MAAPTCVIFDLDETLMPEASSVWAAFSAACGPSAERLGLDSRALIGAARRQARDLWHTSPLHSWCLSIGIASWEGLSGDLGGEGAELAELRAWTEDTDFRASAWAAALAELGVIDARLGAELAERFVNERARHHRLYPDSLTTLEALRSRVRLALLTNGAPRIQRGKIDAVGIGRYFEMIVVSGEIGIGKPDPRAFATITSGLGVSPNDCLMVGDGLATDIAGAAAAGIDSVYIARHGPADYRDARPTFVVDSADGVLGALCRDSLEVRHGWR